MEGAVLGLQEGAIGAAIRAAVDSLASHDLQRIFWGIHKKKHIVTCSFVYI